MFVLRIIRIIFRISKTTIHTEQLRSIYLKQNHNIEGKQWFFFLYKNSATLKYRSKLKHGRPQQKQTFKMFLSMKNKWTHCTTHRDVGTALQGFLTVWKQRTYLTHHSSFMSYEVHLCLFFGSSSPRASFINATDGNPKPSEFKRFKKKMYESVVTLFMDFRFNISSLSGPSSL